MIRTRKKMIFFQKNDKKMENTDFQGIDKARKMLNFQNFAEMATALGMSGQVFTDLKKGKHRVSRKLAEAIHALDERISVAWLMTGDGDAVVVGDGNVTGDNNHVNTGDTLAVAIAEIGEQRKIVSKSQEQIDRLLAIIEKLT